MAGPATSPDRDLYDDDRMPRVRLNLAPDLGAFANRSAKAFALRASVARAAIKPFALRVTARVPDGQTNADVQ
jgi:hypothetical protein